MKDVTYAINSLHKASQPSIDVIPGCHTVFGGGEEP